VVFFLIFIEGDTSPSATSHYFNITRGGSDGAVAVAIGFGAGWLFLGRWKRSSNAPSVSAPLQYGYGLAQFRPEDYKDQAKAPEELYAPSPGSKVTISNSHPNSRVTPQIAPAELAHRSN